MSDPTASPAPMLAPNNLVHVAFCVGVVAAACGLLWLGKVTGAEWVSTVTWTTAILVLGQPVGVVATGFSIAAQAKAAQTIQQIKTTAS